LANFEETISQSYFFPEDFLSGQPSRDLAAAVKYQVGQEGAR
jgi:hypothetical protein